MDSGNTAWLLVCTTLVFLMTPGLAFFYGGLVRANETVNALVMSFIALGVVPVLWAVCGYSIAFSPTGFEFVMLNGVGTEASTTYATSVPHLVFVAYQMMFAVITPALISGAVVGRMKFKAYLVFIALWSVLVYAPLARWVWNSEGWLAKLGVLDFAGGTVVHIAAGVSALVAAIVIGPRSIRADRTSRPHSISLTVLGAGLLFFGWIGFNGGSALRADGIAALATVNTILAASAAVLTWLSIDMLLHKRVSAISASIAAVVGLVAITPGAGLVSPGAAMIIGAVTAVVSYYATLLMKLSKTDDTLDVFACHGIGGVMGSLLTGVYAQAGNVMTQAIGVAVGAGWSAVGTYLILVVLRKVLTVRLTIQEEVTGIDLAEHGETAYDHKTVGNHTNES